jgi:hypothetical protein
MVEDFSGKHEASMKPLSRTSKRMPQRSRWSRTAGTSTAVAVVAGIIDVLQVERAIHASPAVDRVKHLENVFAAIVQMAIAQQKTLSTRRQVKAMVPRKCVRRELSTSAIQSATPFFPVRSYPERHSLVDLGVSERFLSSFVPAKASKRGEPTAQALLQVPAKTILGCRTKRMIRDARNSRFTAFKLLNRYAIVPPYSRD